MRESTLTPDADAAQEEEDAGGLTGALLPRLDILKLLLLVLIVYVPEQLHFPTELGLRGINVLNLLLIATLLGLALRAPGGGGLAPLTGHFLLFWSMVTVAFLISQTKTPTDAWQTANQFKTILTYMGLYFLFYYGVGDRPTIRLMFLAILGVATLAGVEAVREGLDYGGTSYSPTRRAAGPFGVDFRGANRAGVYFGIFIPQLLALALFYRGRLLVRLAALGAFLAGVFGAFYTYSRQSYLCLAMGVFVLALRRSVVLGLLAVVLLASYAAWVPETVASRMAMTTTEDQGGDTQIDPSVADRYEIWAGGMEMLAQNPTGVGLARFPLEIGNYARLPGMDAHNQYVLIAAETGIQGIASYFLLIFGLLALALRLVLRAATDEERVLSSAYLVAVLTLIVGSIYGSPVFMGEVTGNFWALTGLAARSLRLEEEDEHAEEADDSPQGLD